MAALLHVLNDLAQTGWDGLSPIFAAVWSKGVLATLAAVAFVLWAWKAS